MKRFTRVAIFSPEYIKAQNVVHETKPVTPTRKYTSFKLPSN